MRVIGRWYAQAGPLLARRPGVWLLYRAAVGPLLLLGRWAPALIWPVGLAALYVGAVLAAVVDDRRRWLLKAVLAAARQALALGAWPSLGLGAGMAVALRTGWVGSPAPGWLDGFYRPALDDESAPLAALRQGLRPAMMALVFAVLVASAPAVAPAYALRVRYARGGSHGASCATVVEVLGRHGGAAAIPALTPYLS